VEEVTRDFARKGRGGGARRLEVGSERPRGKGWVGLRRPGFVGFQMTGPVLARVKIDVGFQLWKERWNPEGLWAPKGP
jgi:hypothetical protein